MTTLFPTLFGSNTRNTSALGFPDQAPDNNQRPGADALGLSRARSVANPEAPGLFDNMPNKQLGGSLANQVPDILARVQSPSGGIEELVRLLQAQFSKGEQTTPTNVPRVETQRSALGGFGAEVETQFNSTNLLNIVGLRRFTELMGGATGAEIESLVRQAAAGDLEAAVQLLGEDRVQDIGIEGLPQARVDISAMIEEINQQELGFDESVKDMTQEVIGRAQTSLGTPTAITSPGISGIESLPILAQSTDPNAPGFVDPTSTTDDVTGEDGISDDGGEENPFSSLMDAFPDPVPISPGIVVFQGRPGREAVGGVPLAERTSEADRINQTPGLVQPPASYSPRLIDTIQFAARTIAGNPFVSVQGLARMKRGLMPLLNQFDPQFWTRTDPTIVEAMKGLYQSISIRPERVEFTTQQFKPESLR